MFRQLLNPITVKCTLCNENFEKTTWNQKYCDNCRLLLRKNRNEVAQKRILQKKKRLVKICPQCHQVFTITRGDRIYCDRKCSRKANRITFLEKRILEIQQEIWKLKMI